MLLTPEICNTWNHVTTSINANAFYSTTSFFSFIKYIYLLLNCVFSKNVQYFTLFYFCSIWKDTMIGNCWILKIFCLYQNVFIIVQIISISVRQIQTTFCKYISYQTLAEGPRQVNAKLILNKKYKPNKPSATAKLKIKIFGGFLCKLSNFTTAVNVRRFTRKQQTYKVICTKLKLYSKYW